MDFNDFFDMFGGRGGAKGGYEDFDMFNNRGRQPIRKMSPIQMELNLTLEEVFKGEAKRVSYSKTYNCSTCLGKGGSNVKTCSPCKGTGVVITTRSVGPGMYAKSQSPCSSCQGTGEKIDPKDICKTCNGKKVERKIAEVHIPVPKGIPDEEIMAFENQGNESPGTVTGDLHLKVKVQNHPYFKRQGADLYYEKSISLKEALLGFNFEIIGLDGEKIVVSSKKGSFVSNGDIMTIRAKGLPFFQKASGRGNIFVRLNVEYPPSNVITPEFEAAIDSVNKVGLL